MNHLEIVQKWLEKNGVANVPVKNLQDALSVYVSVTDDHTGYKSRLDRRAEFEQIKQDLREAGIDPSGKTYTKCSQEHQSFYANGIVALHKSEIFGK